MTPLECAAILDQWAAKAKTDEQRAACELAAIGIRNAAKSREIVGASGELTIQNIRDAEGEMFIVSSKSAVVGARTLSDALDGLLEKIAKKEANRNECA